MYCIYGLFELVTIITSLTNLPCSYKKNKGKTYEYKNGKLLGTPEVS